MPSYSLMCTDCGHVFTVWRSINESSTPCENCNSLNTEVHYPMGTKFRENHSEDRAKYREERKMLKILRN